MLFEPGDALPEKIGTILSVLFVMPLYVGVALMMARASGFI